ncbi:MAG TPA: NACHT domain-containing protein, partial [Pyrinomonadaceae bacterium]|nr:NACHT domain-containing protein [Pyrinomonadaceae bacterium]
MKRNYSRIKLIVFAALIFVLFALKDLLTEMVGGKIGEYLQTNYGISTRTLVYIFIALLLLGFLYTIYEALTAKKEPNEPTTNNIESDLEILYDSLKERYKRRYDSKLDGRFEITLEVNEDWRFDKPATYKFSAEAKISEAVAAVGKAFDDKGRLLIVGSPGSGKTVLLLNLALRLLGENYGKDKQIPVIFNLASWRESYENFEDWLIEVLNTGNGLSKDFAKTVLREKRLVFLLDGLDELARNEEPQTADVIRAKCMDSLNDYLREGRRTVICCRREEFAAMQKTTAKDAPVSAKTEVLDLTKADIILALQQAQTHNESRAAAENLENLIETNETVLEVLSTPFYFTTALEVFDKPNFNDTDLPTNSDKLKNYLLKNYVENKIKYTAK